MTPPEVEYREIPLTQGLIAYVSPHRYEEMRSFNWSALWSDKISGYYAVRNSETINGKRTVIRMHRQIMGLDSGDPREVDHRSIRNTLDNTDQNLRIVNDAQQKIHQRRRSDNTSGHKGVSFSKRAGKWVAYINYQGKAIHLGYFATKSAAVKAYREAALKYHGEYAEMDDFMCATDFTAYVFAVNRPELLLRSIASFPQLDGYLTVVDNSSSGILVNPEEPWACKSFRIFRPPVPLSYSMSMNWMLADAMRKGVDFIIHFHSDAFSTNPNAVQELLTAVRQYKAEGRRWACAYTHYDLLWAINPAAMQDIGGWDTTFPNYFGDNDAKRRWQLAGWECIDTGIKGIDHEGSATINSDSKLKMLTGHTFELYRAIYIQKHGGGPSAESFAYPYNNPRLDWKP